MLATAQPRPGEAWPSLLPGPTTTHGRWQVADLIGRLTRLARLQAGDHTFLLVSAALANFTLLELPAVVAMYVPGIARVLNQHC